MAAALEPVARRLGAGGGGQHRRLERAAARAARRPPTGARRQRGDERVERRRQATIAAASAAGNASSRSRAASAPAGAPRSARAERDAGPRARRPAGRAPARARASAGVDRRTPAAAPRRGRSARARRSAAGCGSRASSRSSAPSRSPLTVAERARRRPRRRRARPCAARRAKPEPRRVAREPQQPRRDRRGTSASWSTRSSPRVEVLLARPATPRSSPSAEPQRERVDGEVAPREVLLERGAELDVGQRARPRVALSPARVAEVEHARRRRARSRSRSGRARRTSPPSRSAARRATGTRVALDDEVELARVAPEQQVAHRAADDPDAGSPSSAASTVVNSLDSAVEEARRHAGNLEAHAPAGAQAALAADRARASGSRWCCS